MNQRTKLTAIALTAMTLSPVAHAEIVLFAGAQGVVHELDTITGQVAFRGVCSGPVSSMTVHENTLYLGDHNGIVYSLDLDTDLLTGSFAVQSDANAMAWLGSELVVADSAGQISYIDSATHALNSTMTIANSDISALGIDAGGLFVGGLSSLAQRTQIGHENFQFFAACGSMINSMAFSSDTLYIGGIAFGGATQGTVYLFDKFQGGVNYTGAFDIESDATAMVIAEGMLYIAGTDGIIHEMNPQTGTVSRTFNTGIDIQAMTLQSGSQSCPADYDISGTLDFFDISRFLDLFQNQLLPADTNGDGIFNFFDISKFLEIYNGGC